LKARRLVPVAPAGLAELVRIGRGGQAEQDRRQARGQRRLAGFVGGDKHVGAGAELHFHLVFEAAEARQRQAAPRDAHGAIPPRAARPRRSARAASSRAASSSASSMRALMRRTNSPRTVGSRASRSMTASSKAAVSSMISRK